MIYIIAACKNGAEGKYTVKYELRKIYFKRTCSCYVLTLLKIILRNIKIARCTFVLDQTMGTQALYE